MLDFQNIPLLITVIAPMRYGKAINIAKAMECTAIDNKSISDIMEWDIRALGLYLSHLAHESGGFKVTVESGKYRPEVALKVFSKHFKDLDDAASVLSNGDKAFFNRVYGGRMGNAPNEGYTYRGRGWLQLTGKDNYSALSKLTDIDYVTNPDLVSEPLHSAYAANGYLMLNAAFKRALLAHDVKLSCRLLNGGYNGLYDRQRRYDNACMLINGEFDIHEVSIVGDKEFNITIIQHLLAECLNDNNLLIDGHWGPGTSNALEKVFGEVVASVTISDVLEKTRQEINKLEF